MTVTYGDLRQAASRYLDRESDLDPRVDRERWTAIAGDETFGTLVLCREQLEVSIAHDDLPMAAHDEINHVRETLARMAEGRRGAIEAETAAATGEGQ